MAEIDNINKPDVVRPKIQNKYIPHKLGNLQAPPDRFGSLKLIIIP